MTKCMGKKGFTLVELLAVLALMSAIMVIAAPEIIDVGHSMRVKAKNEKLNLLKSAAYNYVSNHKNFCKSRNLASDDENYYKCTITAKELVALGGYKKELSNGNKCNVSNPVDNKCLDDEPFTIKIVKSPNAGANPADIEITVPDVPDTGGGGCGGSDDPVEPSIPESQVQSEESTKPPVESTTPEEPEDECKANNKHNDNFVTYIKSLPSKSNLPKEEHCTYSLFYDGTANNNLRYYGENPCNYVRFNGENWRIIGVMNDTKNDKNVSASRIKLIRDSALGNYSWDTKYKAKNGNSQWGFPISNWNDADLMKELNGDYLDTSLTSDTLWYNTETDSKSTKYHYQFGLKQDAQNKLEKMKWNIGGVPSMDGWKWNCTSTYQNGGTHYDCERLSKLTASVFYNNERGTNVWGSKKTVTNNIGEVKTVRCKTTGYTIDECPWATVWTGKVGLLYPSDYGFAAGSSCLSKDLQYDYENTTCDKENYLHNKGWTITTVADSMDIIWLARDGLSRPTIIRTYVYPVVYLKPNVKLVGGNGSGWCPYEIE